MAESDDRSLAIPIAGMPTQDHQCTAVIEELVAETPESAWNDAERLVPTVA